MEQFYPYFDGDVQAQVKAELGEDKLLVFNPNSEAIYLAQKVGGRYVVDTTKEQSNVTKMVREMEEGTWRKSS